MSRTVVTRRAALAALACAALLSAGVAVAPAASAANEIGLVLYSKGDTQIQFSLCIDAAADLPARVSGSYTVKLDGSVVQTVDITDPEPTAVLISLDPCPSIYQSYAANDLLPGRTYVFEAQVTLTPKVENDVGDFVDDPDRPPVTANATLSTSTTDSNAGTGGGSGGGSDGGSSDGSGGSTGAGSTGGGSTGGGTTTPVVITNPESFTAARLGALSPAQVATIPPVTLGQLPASTFGALTGAQAAELTPQQVSMIRPARAAALRPAAVAALEADALAAMRPAAIRALTPAAIGAMTSAQLRALTPRQVAALQPKQLAALTAAERALLRRS